MKRRDFLHGGSALAGSMLGLPLTLTGCGGDDAPKKNFLLVHGAFHNSRHWSAVAARLTALGHRVATIDLPGFGVNAKVPSSYLTQDLAAFAVEVSPIRDITAASMAQAVVDKVTSLSVQGPVTLVGHSMGGMVNTKAADAVPGLIQRLVYLTALCPSQQKSQLELFSLPEEATATANLALIGDPTLTGATRINPHAVDPAYLELLRAGFYTDLTLAQALPYITLATPDTPFVTAFEDMRGSLAGWGALPRSFVRCLRDCAITPALQDRMIAEADALTPQNKFDVHTLDASHSAFASMPDTVAQLLSNLG